MTDIDPTNPPAVDPPAIDPVPTDPPKDGSGDKDWKAEAEKWTALSRKHEDAEKKLRKEVEDLRTASMSDAEKAIADARKEGEATGLAKVSERLVKATLEKVAAIKGASLPDIDVLNLSRFTADDGEPDVEAIENFVSTLSATGRFADPKTLGIGRTGTSNRPVQYNREEVQRMSHAERVDARKAGHLNDLLGIED